MNGFARPIIVALLFFLVGVLSIVHKYWIGEYSSSTIQLIAGFLLMAIGVAFLSIINIVMILAVEVRLAMTAVLVVSGGVLVFYGIFTAEDDPT